MLKGIDVSGVNSATAVTAGVKTAQFVIVKATEGLTWNDPRHDSIVAQARRGGALVGHYHYAWPEHDPIAEAKHFLSRAKPLPGDLVALDLERTQGGASWPRRVAYAIAWLAYVRQATGASPLLYVNGAWIDGLHANATKGQWASLTSYPLWYAHYSYQPGVFDSRVHQWSAWTAHQFTDRGLDGDVFNGDARVWKTLGVPAKAPSSVGGKVVAAGAGAVLAAGGATAATHTWAPPPKPAPVVKCVTVPAKPVAKPKPKPVVVKPKVVAVFYVVKRGDTLAVIARRYHTTVSALAKANHISNVNVIRVGQRLRVK